MHFGPHHAVTLVDGGANGAFPRLEETGPARTAFEFPIGNKQDLAAACTLERTRPVLLE
jgi:hypothetical protein